VVGPEDPLVAGIYDHFEEAGMLPRCPVIGPSARGARLEGSKAFAKAFMQRNGIPTAAYSEFTSNQIEALKNHIHAHSGPYVLKADGLAAGKGVVITSEPEEAIREAEEMLLGGRFGKAGSRLVVEQFLEGIEFSVFVVTDGKHWKILPEAKDYKRIGEGDTGPNTGGMGAISPVPFVSPELMKIVEETIIAPTIRGLELEGITYKGFIYFGLMLCGGKPWVIEYNCRMGDPETEVVMLRLRSDLVQLFLSLHQGTLPKQEILLDSMAAATTVLASAGYPGDIEKGMPIEAPAADWLFHAGTKREGEQLLTSGGRVMMASGIGQDIQEAVAASQKLAEQVQFRGKYFRRDIGYEFINP
jgi:phosphoribosylamine--glycine ligase